MYYIFIVLFEKYLKSFWTLISLVLTFKLSNYSICLDIKSEPLHNSLTLKVIFNTVIVILNTVSFSKHFFSFRCIVDVLPSVRCKVNWRKPDAEPPPPPPPPPPTKPLLSANHGFYPPALFICRIFMQQDISRFFMHLHTVLQSIFDLFNKFSWYMNFRVFIVVKHHFDSY